MEASSTRDPASTDPVLCVKNGKRSNGVVDYRSMDEAFDEFDDEDEPRRLKVEASCDAWMRRHTENPY